MSVSSISASGIEISDSLCFEVRKLAAIILKLLKFITLT
jgi:hypothetical protein